MHLQEVGPFLREALMFSSAIGQQASFGYECCWNVPDAFGHSCYRRALKIPRGVTALLLAHNHCYDQVLCCHDPLPYLPPPPAQHHWVESSGLLCAMPTIPARLDLVLTAYKSMVVVFKGGRYFIFSRTPVRKHLQESGTYLIWDAIKEASLTVFNSFSLDDVNCKGVDLWMLMTHNQFHEVLSRRRTANTQKEMRGCIQLYQNSIGLHVEEELHQPHTQSW